jgi:hypothetical protein
MTQQDNFIVKVGENPEKLEGALKTVAHKLQAPVKGFPGGAAAAFGKDIVQIAAPEPQPGVKGLAVPGYPLFFPPDTLSHQQKGSRGFANGLHDHRFLLPLKGTGVTAHNTQPGEGLADIAFGLPQYPQFPPQKENGKFPLFQHGKQAYHQIEGHVPDRPLSGKEADSPHDAFRNGDDQGGVSYIPAVLVVPPGLKQIHQGKEDHVLGAPLAEQFIHHRPQLFGGYDVDGYL